jgi:hypothetical protein
MCVAISSSLFLVAKTLVKEEAIHLAMTQHFSIGVIGIDSAL